MAALSPTTTSIRLVAVCFGRVHIVAPMFASQELENWFTQSLYVFSPESHYSCCRMLHVMDPIVAHMTLLKCKYIVCQIIYALM